jgi:hypothetical protein
MKRKTILSLGALVLLLTSGGLSFSFADGEGTPTTYVTEACFYVGPDGNPHYGTYCNQPSYQGPCPYKTACR